MRCIQISQNWINSMEYLFLIAQWFLKWQYSYPFYFLIKNCMDELFLQTFVERKLLICHEDRLTAT